MICSPGWNFSEGTPLQPCTHYTCADTNRNSPRIQNASRASSSSSFNSSSWIPTALWPVSQSSTSWHLRVLQCSIFQISDFFKSHLWQDWKFVFTRCEICKSDLRILKFISWRFALKKFKINDLLKISLEDGKGLF